MVAKRRVVKDWFWRLTHRKSRSEVVAFSMGMKVGRELAIVVGIEESEIIINRIAEEAQEDYR